jgi:hypothetical protein
LVTRRRIALRTDTRAGRGRTAVWRTRAAAIEEGLRQRSMCQVDLDKPLSVNGIFFIDRVSAAVSGWLGQSIVLCFKHTIN